MDFSYITLLDEFFKFACYECPDTVRVLARNRKCPPIAQEDGTIFRKATVDDHFDTFYHKEAVKAFKLKSLSTSKLSVVGSIEIAISKVNEALSDKIGGLMILVYYDVKRLTLSANSFFLVELLWLSFQINSNSMQISIIMTHHFNI